MDRETGIEMLDFSKPPPGYHVGPESDYWYWIRGPEGGEGHRGDVAPSEQEVISAAWAHHKARHDPPGIEVFSDDGTEEHWCFAACDTAALCDSPHGSRQGARAAAWAWYEDRVHLAEQVERATGNGYIWPYALTWSDDQAVAVKRWLSDSTVELPDVLRPERLRQVALQAMAREQASVEVTRG